ncbi:hypothetical protein CEXT_178331 [Caerostris extrusa]|uniref:Secreted protein n=1 Tax=Caerostris extrusa TaxID=172846 RepID=A0AAV4QP62_CAEEX|nr:hypothetical protein CEXT_178331 [Caerostris extrusa]
MNLKLTSGLALSLTAGAPLAMIAAMEKSVAEAFFPRCAGPDPAEVGWMSCITVAEVSGPTSSIGPGSSPDFRQWSLLSASIKSDVVFHNCPGTYR